MGINQAWARALTDERVAFHLRALSADMRAFKFEQRSALLEEAAARIERAAALNERVDRLVREAKGGQS